MPRKKQPKKKDKKVIIKNKNKNHINIVIDQSKRTLGKKGNNNPLPNRYRVVYVPQIFQQQPTPYIHQEIIPKRIQTPEDVKDMNPIIKPTHREEIETPTSVNVEPPTPIKNPSDDEDDGYLFIYNQDGDFINPFTRNIMKDTPQSKQKIRKDAKLPKNREKVNELKEGRLSSKPDVLKVGVILKCRYQNYFLNKIYI